MRITKLRQSVLNMFEGSDRQAYTSFRGIIETHPHWFISFERNRAIVLAYFTPSDDGRDPTLRSLAKKHKLSHERVRQIIARSIRIVEEQLDDEQSQPIRQGAVKQAVSPSNSS